MKDLSPCFDSIAKYFIKSAATAYYCDLKNETVMVLQDLELQTKELKDMVQDYHQAVTYYAEGFVHPDDRHILYEYMDPVYARDTLKTKPSYSFDYREVYQEMTFFYRGVIMRGEDEDHVIILFWNITEDLKKEQLQIQAANEAKKLVDNMTATFNIVYLVDLKTDDLQVLRMDDHMLESQQHFKTFSQARRFFLNKVAHFRDRDFMARELDTAVIKAKLKDSPTYSVEYRVLKDNVTLGGEMTITAIENDHIVIGMAGSDLELVLRHMQQKRYDDYFALFVIDLDTEMLKVMKVSPWYKTGKVGEAAPYTTVIQAFAQSMDPEPREFFMQLSDIAFVKRELAHEDKHTYSYRSNLQNNKWVSVVSYVTIRHEDGTPAEFTLGFSHVDSMESRSKDAERLIREQDAQLKQQLEMIQGLASGYHALYYFNIEKHSFKLYSVDKERFPEIKDIIGKGAGAEAANPIEAFLNFGQSELVHPDDRHVFEELTVSKVFAELAHKKKFTTRFRRRFGKKFLWTELDIIKYEDIDEKPNTIVLGFAERDKEIRMEREAAMAQDLADQQRHIKAFGDMINAALWSIDVQGKDEIVAVNWSDELRHMLGYTDEQDFPNTMSLFYELLHPEDRDTTLDQFKHAICSKSDGIVYDVRYRVMRKSGEYCWYHAIGRLERKLDGTRGIYGIITDISADIELERQKEQLEKDIKIIEAQQIQLKEALSMAQSANLAKTTFLNNMSHDIRTPMNAIIGFTGLAEGHIDEKDKVLDYLGKIGQSSDHLLSLINDVLDMSRIESGKMNLEEGPENLSDILHSLSDMTQAEIQAKNHKFFIETVGVKDKDIICDRLRLNQVLLNILSNSIKYTPAGGTIMMRITEKKVKSSGYALYEFRIKDNGMGMSKEYLQMIFEPFTRVKSTTVSGIQGTGLGMAITKSIVDIMGGRIEVQSELGKGTETTVTFDFRLAKSAESAKKQSGDLQVDLTGSRILLVEDNDLNREIATAILEEMGCVVTPAEDGDIAVDRIRNGKSDEYDLVLMDIQMPTLNGYDATRQIRALGTQLSHVPIIAMTANAFEEDRKAALEAGMDEHLAKPINPGQLSNVMARFLKKKK